MSPESRRKLTFSHEVDVVAAAAVNNDDSSEVVRKSRK